MVLLHNGVVRHEAIRSIESGSTRRVRILLHLILDVLQARRHLEHESEAVLIIELFLVDLVIYSLFINYVRRPYTHARFIHFYLPGLPECMVLTPYQDRLMVFCMLISLSRALCSTYVDESSCCFFPFKVSIYHVSYLTL